MGTQKPSSGMRVGIAWYSEAEWPQLRERAADRENLEPTYADWLKVYYDGLSQLAASGVIAEPVEVLVADLEEWCRLHSRPLDAKARSEFAAEILRRKYEGPKRWP